MKAYVFPGQGSQKKGMGEGLFDEFADLTKKADEILGYSIKDLCLNDPEQKLVQTQFTQPALYTVSALSYLKKIQTTGKKADFLAGHSLGEYSALFAAGVFSFETGLNLVKKRGELMSKAKSGAMAAIINSSEKQILEILKEANLTTIDIANYNSPSQIIISGLKEDLSNSQTYFEKTKCRFVPLNTSGAFHSRYMKESAEKFEKFIKKYEFSKPEIPIIANVSAKPYELDRVAQNLVDQIYNSVRWTDSIYYLLDQGVTEFEELGVGDILTKLIIYIKKDWQTNVKAAPEQSEKDKPVRQPETCFKFETVKTDDTNGKNEVSSENGSALEKAWQKDLDPHTMVEKWNNVYPVGTKVHSDLYDHELETRTEAIVLFGHRAAIYMKEYNGYFDLREVTPVK